MQVEKKRLLHIIPSLTIGGAEKLIYNSICILPEYEHHVVSFQADPFFLTEFKQLAKVYLKHTTYVFTPANIAWLRKIERKVKPDIIHSHLLKTNWLTRFAFKRTGKLVNSIHSLYSVDAFPFHFYTKLLERYSYRNSRAVLIFVSELVKADYNKSIPLFRKNYVVNNFVPNEYFQINTLKYQRETRLRLIAVGNLKKLKNYRLLIEVFKKLKEYPISLDVYGDGDLTEEYKSDINRHGLNIRLKGKVKSVASVLPGYHAFIFPSLYEGLSISLLEAMSASMPLLLSGIPAFENIVKQNAYYFDPENAETCRDAILKMYTTGFPQSWISDNRNLAVQNFSEATYKQKLEDIYRTIAS
jgi:glycosyltransferase involved in cell wall biosynthesis